MRTKHIVSETVARKIGEPVKRGTHASVDMGSFFFRRNFLERHRYLRSVLPPDRLATQMVATYSATWAPRPGPRAL
jgi:hypothetical protein